MNRLCSSDKDTFCSIFSVHLFPSYFPRFFPLLLTGLPISPLIIPIIAAPFLIHYSLSFFFFGFALPSPSYHYSFYLSPSCFYFSSLFIAPYILRLFSFFISNSLARFYHPILPPSSAAVLVCTGSVRVRTGYIKADSYTSSKGSCVQTDPFVAPYIFFLTSLSPLLLILWDINVLFLLINHYNNG